jgi:5-methylcytosine-specific restriction endonuclease McrA
MSVLNRLVLVLNTSYEGVNICTARRALTLVFKGAATVVEVSPNIVHTSKINIPVPSVIRLLRYRYVPHITRSVSRKGILLRDRNVCQYCARALQPQSLTLDHVIPKSRGGPTTWLNTVSCCFACNNKKANRTPDEAGMTLLHKPIQLSAHAKYRLLKGNEGHSWDKYIFA